MTKKFNSDHTDKLKANPNRVKTQTDILIYFTYCMNIVINGTEVLQLNADAIVISGH